MPEVWGDWRGDLTGWGTLEDKGKFIGVGCLWTGGEAPGAGGRELRGKKPAEMDHEAALLVLAAPKSNRPAMACALARSRPARPPRGPVSHLPFVGRADPSFHAA